MRKKFWKKLRVLKGFVAKVFGRRIVRDVFGFILVLAILYFSISGVLILALRTETYWMSVTSNSMKHDYEGWREIFETDGYDTSKFPLQGGFEKGDLIVTKGIYSVSEVAVGDVVIMDQGPSVIPLVHRVVEIYEENGRTCFKTRGDAYSNRNKFEYFDQESVLGKVIFVIPKIGWISLWFRGY